MKKYIQQNKRVVVVLAAVPVIVIMGFLFGLVYTGSTKEIIAVADQFQPDPSWTLESETITPPRIICIDSVCPQVVRSWSVGALADSDISLIASSYGGSTVRDRDCVSSGMGGFVSICSFEAKIQKFTVRFSVLQDSEDLTRTQILQFVN